MSRNKNDLTNKFSRDGYEAGMSKASCIRQGVDGFGMSVEFLRKLFVKIRNPEKYPELDNKVEWNEDGTIKGMDNTRFAHAAERGQRLEPLLRDWACDKLDDLCYEYNQNMSCEVRVPTIGYRKKEHRMVASLDAILEITNGKLPYTCPHTGEEHTLSGKGALELKTSSDSLVPSIDNVLQIQGQMYCANLNWGFIGILNKKQHFNLHYYARNQNIIDGLIESYDNFWNKVDNDIAYPEVKPTKEFVDYNNHNLANSLAILISRHKESKSEIDKWSTKEKQIKEEIMSVMKTEKQPYISLGGYNLALDIVTRQATPEQVVPAKPSTSYEKLTIKEI